MKNPYPVNLSGGVAFGKNRLFCRYASWPLGSMEVEPQYIRLDAVISSLEFTREQVVGIRLVRRVLFTSFRFEFSAEAKRLPRYVVFGLWGKGEKAARVLALAGWPLQ